MSYKKTPFSAANSFESYVNRELSSIELAFRELAQTSSFQLQPTYVEPVSPQASEFRYARDPWNPGSGDGLYIYNASGSWVFITAL